MKIFTPQFAILEYTQKKRLNELKGETAFAKSHGMCRAWFLFNKWRVTKWSPLKGGWDSFEKQIDEGFLTYLWKTFVGMIRRNAK